MKSVGLQMPSLTAATAATGRKRSSVGLKESAIANDRSGAGHRRSLSQRDRQHSLQTAECGAGRAGQNWIPDWPTWQDHAEPASGCG